MRARLRNTCLLAYSRAPLCPIVSRLKRLAPPGWKVARPAEDSGYTFAIGAAVVVRVAHTDFCLRRHLAGKDVMVVTVTVGLLSLCAPKNSVRLDGQGQKEADEADKESGHHLGERGMR